MADAPSSDWRSFFDWALDETSRVERRLQELLDSRICHFGLLLGLLPNGTRRIATELENQSVQDNVAVVLASRVFTDAMGAYLLLRKGLWTQGTALTRTTLESVAQAVALLRNSEMAENWNGGKRYSPGEIRKSLGGFPDFGSLYNALTAISHANPEATWSHSVPVQGLGIAVSYSGTYQPQRGAEMFAILADISLIYLHEFFSHYASRLAIANWPMLMEVGHTMNDDLRIWAKTLPNDWESLQDYLTKLKQEPMPASPVSPEEALKMAEQLRMRRVGRIASGSERAQQAPSEDHSKR